GGGTAQLGHELRARVLDREQPIAPGGGRRRRVELLRVERVGAEGGRRQRRARTLRRQLHPQLVARQAQRVCPQRDGRRRGDAVAERDRVGGRQLGQDQRRHP